MKTNELEKYSSAITLSDMEIFVFPELMYSLVLANIMSPVLWEWQETSWYEKIKDKTPYRKLMRLKQHIMDEFDFNLDLETWGLTSQDKELARFKKYILPEQISNSNALFGYHGDKYYYDLDIRRHFGLDKYNDDVIPYWKTETVEAMAAFRYKKGYSTGAGECVSLAALYAAAAFIVCDIPLEDIWMVLTPLHSQNFIDLGDGILTNNRRVVTKNMWFNGSEISAKAQRALKNENVTIVAHPTGIIHTLYPDATIDRDNYLEITRKLKSFLTSETTLPMIANFLRCHTHFQKHFQFCKDCHGDARFIKAETLYHYEHGSKYRIGEPSCDKLLDEVSNEDLYRYRFQDRICCKELDHFLSKKKIDVRNPQKKEELRRAIEPYIPESRLFVDALEDFIHTEPRLPAPDKKFTSNGSITLTPDMNRHEIIGYLQSIRAENTMADLAFYAYRDMASSRWEPFIKAAVERNPVSLELTAGMTVPQVAEWLNSLPADSIYREQRCAQPDEVANYLRGDGLEKAVFLANVILARMPSETVQLIADGSTATIISQETYSFSSQKGLHNRVSIASGKINVSS
ncbi:hypothetical protein KDK77_01060 [bacterium]|nr:hypothetical protein [bacterium]